MAKPRSAGNRIDTVTARDGLKPRREPYWEKMTSGCFLGFRKMARGSEGTWIARFRDFDGKQKYHSLGDFLELSGAYRYDAAKREADKLFSHLGAGGAVEKVTIATVCDRYLRDLKASSGAKAFMDADARLRRWVLGDRKFAAIELQKLRRDHLRAWREQLQQTPVVIGAGDNQTIRERSSSAINRDVTTLRAALNWALRDGLITTSLAWDDPLKPIKHADKRRNIYLDANDRKAFVAAATGATAIFLRALCLLPLRPGALAALTVNAFNPKLKTLAIGKDKSGQDRAIPLPDATAAFFAEQRRGKLPGAPLIANAAGKHWTKDEWKGPVKAAAIAAGLPTGTTAYALRHSVITDLVKEAKLDTLTVAQLSGTSIAMIEKHYGQYTKHQARAALATLAL